jgi:hypothetical protein
MPVIRPGPAERAETICTLLKENGVSGYQRAKNPAYHRANAWEYIASPPGNWPHISVDCQHNRAIVLTPDFDGRQTRSFCLFLGADLTALVVHVKHLHETWDDSPGPLDLLARAIADHFRRYGLDVIVMDPATEVANPGTTAADSGTVRIIQAFDTQISPADKWIAIRLISENLSVKCEVSEIGGYEDDESMRDIYSDTCDLNDFDPEKVVPTLVARLLI